MKKNTIDKKLHFIVGFIIALSSVFIGIWGLVAAIVAGVVKEIRDYVGYGKYDVYDMLATWVGGIVGYIVSVVLTNVLQIL